MSRVAMRRVSLVIGLGLLSCVGSNRAAEKTTMPMDVEFKIETSELLFQENPNCLLTLKNAGAKTIQVLHPATTRRMPIVRVVNLRDGAETLFQKPPELMADNTHQPLKPGQSIERGFQLLEEVSLLEPGEYDISVIYEYNEGEDRAESAPVRVRVRPTTPRNLSLASVQGGESAVLYGAWINVASDPPEIVRSRFDAMPGGGAGSAIAIGNASFNTRPVLSTPPNRSVAHSHWIAWLEDTVMQFTHFDAELGGSGLKKIDLPSAELEIVAPLFSDAVKDTRVRPNGTAVVWGGNRDGTLSRLLVIHLTRDKAAAGAQIDLPLPRPRWIQSHQFSRGNRVVTFIHTENTSATLQIVSLPAEVGGVASSPRKLCSWVGTFLAAGATLDSEDTIQGASLLWTGQGENTKLELVGWAIDAQGTLAEKGRQTIQWDYSVPIDRSLVRVSGRGVRAALLRNPGGQWFVYNGRGSISQVSGAFAQTKLLIDLAFLGSAEPVLIGAEENRGFRLTRVSGGPLPSDQ